MRLRYSIYTAVLLAGCLLVGAAAAQDSTPEAMAAEPALLSAFFGLDNALPTTANGLCRGARGQDGMPVIFSEEIDPDTLQAEDFAVTTEGGVISTPFCATLSPAVDVGELRTVLLIGEFGSAESDPPALVEVVGAISGISGADFVGARGAVTPLAAGPTLVVSEQVPPEQWRLDQSSGRQQGNGCPSDGTVQIVRVTWAGGITTAEDEEAGDAERALYRVTVRAADGTETEVTPFALADIGDGDNNHLLCLDEESEPVSVFFPAGHLYDPNADAPNPDTTVLVAILSE